MQEQLTIGILAHVDSGKTTLSEALLYSLGEIRSLGRVDHKTTFLDTHTLEKGRGITIFSKQALLNLPSYTIALLDTPGHIDFSPEAERTLQVLDYAILVISGSEGVQAHTRTLWNLLKEHHIPTFLFINKMDLSVESMLSLMGSLKEELSSSCINFSYSEETEFFDDLTLSSESLLEEMLNTETIQTKSIGTAIKNREVFPCYFGSALKLDGITAFLNGLERFLLPQPHPSAFGAKVFKISEDSTSRLTHLKITGGSLKTKDLICYQNEKQEMFEEKINQIRIYSGKKYITADEAPSGTVCAVTGLTGAMPGKGLGFEKDSPHPLLFPVLTYKACILDDTPVSTLLSSLRRLEAEEPSLCVFWNSHLSEIRIRIMGKVQIEILESILKERFHISVSFSEGSILYRESILSPVEGVGHYEPLKHYAEVHLLLEPLPQGSGLVFASSCSEDNLDKNWQRLILTHLQEKTHIGVLTGSPITDMKITLTAGKAHEKHTEGGDFREATYRALRQGLMRANSVLLEPYYDFRLSLPAEYVGRAMADLTHMGATFTSPTIENGLSVLTGTGSVYELQEYPLTVAGYTKGEGKLSFLPSGYRPCHNSEEVISSIGYRPENDTENPADSVFCSHGAGHLVPWNQVENHMHIKHTGKPTCAITQEQVNRLKERLSEDEELLRIFERTYGPIKTHLPHTSLSPTKQASTYPNLISAKKPTCLLVDGYNIIFAWKELKEEAEKSLESARAALINRMINYHGFLEGELILVFDAYKVKGNPGSIEKQNGIYIVYTKEAETADTYIERISHEKSKDYHVRVATSDALEQLIILGNGAIRIPEQAFHEEVDAIEKAIRQVLKEHAVSCSSSIKELT